MRDFDSWWLNDKIWGLYTTSVYGICLFFNLFEFFVFCFCFCFYYSWVSLYLLFMGFIIQLTFNFFLIIFSAKNFQFQLNKLFPNRPYTCIKWLNGSKLLTLKMHARCLIRTLSQVRPICGLYLSVPANSSQSQGLAYWHKCIWPLHTQSVYSTAATN